LTFDTSTTNAVLNAFGVVYFLDKRKPVMLLVCMAVLLLTGSNFTNLILIFVLALLFIFKSTRDQKSLIAICVMFLVVFMVNISPQNNKDAFDSIENAFRAPKPQAAAIAAIAVPVVLSQEDVKRKAAQSYIDSVCAAAAKKQQVKAVVKTAPALPNNHGRILIAGPDINKPPYLTPTDTTPDERRLLTFIDAHKNSLPISRQASFKEGVPGKVTGLLQTVHFLKYHPVKIIAGSGVGNFSSKLAFKATGLGLEGGYPAKFVYISRDFLSNHLDIYLNFFSKRNGLHSLTNSPFSVYDQLLAEYGLAGIAAFIIGYLGFFANHYKT